MGGFVLEITPDGLWDHMGYQGPNPGRLHRRQMRSNIFFSAAVILLLRYFIKLFFNITYCILELTVWLLLCLYFLMLWLPISLFLRDLYVHMKHSFTQLIFWKYIKRSYTAWVFLNIALTWWILWLSVSFLTMFSLLRLILCSLFSWGL